MTPSEYQPLPRLLARFDPFDPELDEQFFQVVDDLRERCPMAHSDAQGGFWAISRFGDVLSGLTDEEGLSPIPTVSIPPNPGAVPIIPLQSQPAEHRAFRRLLDPYFRASSVTKYEGGIRNICTELIDGFIERGRCEFIGEFARRLPGGVIFRLFLGLPEDDLDEAFRWTLGIVQSINQPGGTYVHQNFLNLIGGWLDARLAEPRRDDVVDALLHGRVLDRPLTRDEVRRTLLQLIAAGLRTTASALGYVMIRLGEQPRLRRTLQAQPGLLPAAVEEFLRIDAPSAGAVRTAMRDVVVRGTQIKEGERVWLLLAGANRDPREFDAPDEVDFDRGQMRHLAFGYGAHYCLGVHLARLEMRVALEELLLRLSDFKVDGRRVRYDSGCSRGPSELHLSFAPGPRAVSRHGG
jgi:cytochrome P450